MTCCNLLTLVLIRRLDAYQVNKPSPGFVLAYCNFSLTQGDEFLLTDADVVVDLLELQVKLAGGLLC